MISVAYLPSECFLPSERDPHRWQIVGHVGAYLEARHAMPPLPFLEPLELDPLAFLSVGTEVLERHHWIEHPIRICVYYARRDEAVAIEQLQVASFALRFLAWVLTAEEPRRPSR